MIFETTASSIPETTIGDGYKLAGPEVIEGAPLGMVMKVELVVRLGVTVVRSRHHPPAMFPESEAASSTT